MNRYLCSICGMMKIEKLYKGSELKRGGRCKSCVNSRQVFPRRNKLAQCEVVELRVHSLLKSSIVLIFAFLGRSQKVSMTHYRHVEGLDLAESQDEVHLSFRNIRWSFANSKAGWRILRRTIFRIDQKMHAIEALAQDYQYSEEYKSMELMKFLLRIEAKGELLRLEILHHSS